MSVEQTADTLVARVLSTGSRRLRQAAARGMLPLPPQDLVALQVALALSEDREVAGLAESALATLDPKALAEIVAEATGSEILSYFAQPRHHPMILEAVLLHRATPPDLLVELAPSLSPELQEILLLRQDAVVERPEILDRLEANPELSSYCARRIREYRRHLLPSEPEAVEEPAVEGEAEEATDEEVRQAVEKARSEPAEGDRDHELTGLSEGQIRTLPVPVRLKLARGAPRSLRSILVRDKNPQVACAVLIASAVSESEVELIASSRSVIDDVLEAIGRSHQWTRKYGIVSALVRNPRTPAGLAVRLLPRLSVRDLRALSRDRNVTEVVRSRSAALYKIKLS